jgi:Predicted glycosyl hydrolase
MKKSVSLLLLLSLMMPSSMAFFACGTTSDGKDNAAGSTSGTDTDTAAETTAETAAETAAGYISGLDKTTVAKMAESVFDAFIAEYYDNGTFIKADFWDNAEIFETVVDAYERTGNDKYKKYIEEIAAATFGKYSKKWSSNIYNDDIMWLVIAYTRAYILTGNKDYLKYAKINFDDTWSRAYSDDLGGGLWWRTDNQSKNSCINGPSSIAACLIGKVTCDARYYEKAALAMEWEIANLFEPDTGRVYDSMSVEDKSVNKWASTYNQGTFIGACNMLYDYYKDEKYLEYAGKAADYAINVMYSGKVMNNETSGGDLIGFKGILTRWLSRYATYTNNTEIIKWLQENAAAAWSNRNSKGLIWTAWDDKTSDNIKDYDVFGMSTAVALMFNCEM